MTTTTSDASPDFPVPEGFFDEISAALRTETAEDIAETVIAACISRGIVHPELEEDPDDELRAVQMGEVFALVGAVSAAVAAGTIIPAGVRILDTMDPDMELAWEDFTDSASDPEVAQAAAEMLRTGCAQPAPAPAPAPAAVPGR